MRHCVMVVPMTVKSDTVRYFMVTLSRSASDKTSVTTLRITTL